MRLGAKLKSRKGVSTSRSRSVVGDRFSGGLHRQETTVPEKGWKDVGQIGRRLPGMPEGGKGDEGTPPAFVRLGQRMLPFGLLRNFSLISGSGKFS